MMKFGNLLSAKSLLKSIYDSIDHKPNVLLTFFLCVLVSLFYFVTHIRVLKYFLLNIPVVVFIFLVLKNRSVRFKINSTVVVLVGIILTLTLAIVYSYFAYKDFGEHKFVFTETLFASLYYILLGIVSVGSYLSIPTLLGLKLVRIFKSPSLIFSFMLGLIFLALAFIMVGLSGFFNKYFVYCFYSVGLISSIVLFVKLRLKKYWNLQLNLSLFKLYIFICLLLFISVVSAISIRSHTWGSDALRQYFVIPKYIMETGKLPSYEYVQSLPYLVELIFTPAFILGGYPVLIFTTYFISSMFIIILYFILKNHFVGRVHLWMILPAFLTSVFLAFYASEYKTDITVLLFVTITTYAFLYFKDRLNIGSFILFSLFAGFTMFAKITPLPYIAVLYTSSLVLLYKRYKLSNLYVFAVLKGGLAFFIFPIIFFIFYQVTLPFIGSFGLNLSTGRFLPVFSSFTNYCVVENRSFETTWRYDKESSRFISAKTLINLFVADDDIGILTIFDLSDLGLLIALPVIVFILLFALAGYRVYHFKMIFFASLLGVVTGLLFYPYEIWYWNYALIILVVTTNVNIYYYAKSKNNKFIKAYSMMIYLISIAYIYSYALSYVRAFYFPLTLSQEQIAQSLRYSQNRPNHADAYQIGKYLNSNLFDDEKVLISSSVSYSNVYVYFDKFYDRYIFNDQIRDFTDESVFLDIILRKNVKYLILSRGSVEYGIECIKNQQRELETLYDKYGTLVLVKPNYYLYKVNLSESEID